MSTRQYSSKQENYVAKQLGGTPTPNSGAGHTKKGDILVDDFYIIECKTKTQPVSQVTVKKEWLDTVRKEGLAMGRPYYSVVIDFGVQGKDTYAIIPLDDLKMFIDYIRGE